MQICIYVKMYLCKHVYMYNIYMHLYVYTVKPASFCNQAQKTLNK